MFVPSYSEVLVLLKGKPLLYVKTPCFHCRNKLEFLLFIQLSSKLKRNRVIYFLLFNTSCCWEFWLGRSHRSYYVTTIGPSGVLVSARPTRGPITNRIFFQISRSSDFVITRIITDRIGDHSVLLV